MYRVDVEDEFGIVIKSKCMDSCEEAWDYYSEEIASNSDYGFRVMLYDTATGADNLIEAGEKLVYKSYSNL